MKKEDLPIEDIDLVIKRIPITAKTRKLKFKYTIHTCYDELRKNYSFCGGVTSLLSDNIKEVNCPDCLKKLKNQLIDEIMK
jgi:hypothetical protein